MKRTPLNRKTPMKRGSSQLARTAKLPHRSKAKQKEMREASKQLTRLISERGNRCEVCPKIRKVLPSWRGCAGHADPVEGRHHLRKQSATTDESDANVLLACNLSNGWIEDNPRLAHSAHLVIRRGDPDWDSSAEGNG